MPSRRSRLPLVLALFVAISPLSHATAPQVVAATTLTRLAGSDRYATAVELSRASFPSTVPVAFVATGRNFPDALAGAPLAAAQGGPLLLSTSDALPSATGAELARLRPGRIVILGGPASVSPAVERALHQYTTGSVTRLAGPDRYATAVAVSQAGFARGVGGVYVATGANFPDALAASAAAARARYPVLLVGRDTIPSVVRAELARLQPGQILVAGGAGVVSESVRASLAGYTSGGATRIAGSDRYATAVAISQRHFQAADVVYLATGANYPDALAAARAAGVQHGPVLLTRSNTVPATVVAELARLKPSRVVVVGGRRAITDAAANMAVSAAEAGANSCSARPASAPAGWRRAVTSDFSEVTPIGSWPGPVAARDWRNRQGARDSSGRGVYDSSKTLSEANGLLDVWIHSEVAGRPGVHDPNGQRYVAAPIAAMGPVLGQRISVCMRADVIPGYKLAYLLWPSEGTGNQLGEIDFPEGRLIGLPATAKAFMHYAPKPVEGRHQDAYDSGASLQGWHTYTIEWNPRAATPYVTFFIDGRLLGHSTQFIPRVPMQYVMQMETFLRADALPAPAQGHVQIDWVTIDVPS